MAKPNRRKGPQSENRPERVILHCAATPDTLPHEEGFDRWGADDIREWHKERGFKDIGYHFVIRRSGKIEEGRHIEKQGAHCAAMGGNHHSIGICLVGTKMFTPEQMDSLFSLYLKFRDRISYRDWFGHSEFDEAKPNCPGLDMNILRHRLSSL